MRRAIRAVSLLLMLVSVHGFAATPVPDPLQPWRAWVLSGEEFRDCPFLATRAPGSPDAHHCAWPGALSLELDASGGQFRQSWQAFAATWIVLPGNTEHWPRDVRIDGNAAPVVMRAGVPQLLVERGNHVVSGRFAWSNRPEMLPVATQTAVVQLVLDGRVVTQPERPNGAVWLGQRRSTVERDQLQISVYRLLTDEIPARLTTHLRLQVSGTGREVVLPRALPDGFVPLALEGDLPARLEADGRLRVQLRPGTFRLTLDARAAGVATSITRPVTVAPWPEEEIWSFRGIDWLRVAAVEGAESIDPAQAEVPDEWNTLPAYRMPAAGQITIVERSRALANIDDNRLSLGRQMWLDFNHEGFTVKDELAGRLNRDRRLDMALPYTLASADSPDGTLLVTVGANGATGVELRDQQLVLEATSRVQQGRGRMPATGWSTRFDSVQGILHLPPGHRLLGVLGADQAPESWIARWGLWHLFGVLIVVVFTGWVAGRAVAIVAALALLLIYQEMPLVTWLWANILAAIAIHRAAPEGWLRRVAGSYRCAAFVILGLALLPLLVGQLRLALYPDLAVDESRLANTMAVQFEGMDAVKLEAVARSREVPAPAPAAATPPPVLAEPAVPQEAPPMNVGSGSASFRQQQPSSVLNRYTSVSSRYAAGTLLQTGPGVPAWRYNTYLFGWSGPVEPSQGLRFVYVGPILLGVWRIAAVLLAALFTLMLARAAFGVELKLPRLPASLRGSGAAAMLVAVCALAAQPQVASAQAFPSSEMLDDLKARLIQPPSCGNACAEIMSADVNADGDRLQVTLEASALARLAVALPHAGDRWQLESVQVDGRSAMFALREADNSMWLPLGPGAHRISLAGRLANAESVQLNFPQPPRTVRVTSRGWDSSGVTNGRLLSGSVELTRRRATGSAAASLAPSEFAPFVRVTRNFELDLDWRLRTLVERIAPRAAPLQVEVPLVAGESVLTDGVEIRDGRMVVGLARGQHELAWQSRLERGETITVSLPADAQRSERWVFAVNPQWHAEFAGLPAVQPDEVPGDSWLWHFHPRPGETLTVKITRPAAAPGSSFAIDSVRHTTQFGKRSLNGSLQLKYRSTQGGRQTITLPEDLRVTQVISAGQSVPVRPDQGKLLLSLLPGEHSIDIDWTAPRGAGLAAHPDHIDLGSAAANITTRLNLPADRWPLFVRGPGVGTTLLYWGELFIFALAAAALAWLPRSPLRFHAWLLLGLGLSTLSWWVFAGVAAWLIIMRWRRDWDHADQPRWRFNVAQLLLAALAVIAVTSLVFSGVRYGLLATPDMGLAGPGMHDPFEWFLDRSASQLPEPVVISVPMWIYRLLMFAWALWVALALSRWLKDAWQAWIAGGMWRGRLSGAAAG